LLGEAALKSAKDELGENIKSEIVYHQLEITDEQSCKAFAAYLKSNYVEITALINNAAIAFKNNASESPGIQADETLRVNYYGTKLISSYLIPLIHEGGRVVNVASLAGVMKGLYRQDLIDNFKRNDFTVRDIDNFVEEYKKVAHDNQRKEKGFPESAYRVSKAAVIALSLVQQRELEVRNIIVNACCPGFVDTDMTSHKGHLTIAQGADTPIWLVSDPNPPKGKFVKERKIFEWL